MTIIEKLRSSRQTQILILRYLLIGGIVFCIDVGTFQLFLRAHLALTLATVLSYVISVVAHFSLNRSLNFRNFDRSLLSQASTYMAIVFVQMLITIAIVQVAVQWLGLMPIVGKITAIALNIPLGFLAHRYLTFSGGILKAIRRLLPSAQLDGRVQ